MKLHSLCNFLSLENQMYVQHHPDSQFNQYMSSTSGVHHQQAQYQQHDAPQPIPMPEESSAQRESPQHSMEQQYSSSVYHQQQQQPEQQQQQQMNRDSPTDENETTEQQSSSDQGMCNTTTLYC